jgi:uncharacterized protein YbjT (DUF2867 family)
MEAQMRDPILVLGARGKLGRAVVDHLRAAGAPTRCATRDPGCCGHDCVGGGCARFDYDRPETFAPALEGVNHVFVVARPLDAAAAHVMIPFFEACAAGTVEHVVLTTALGVDQNPAAPLQKVEAYLRGSSLGWTILRPNFFMENFSDGEFRAAIADGGVIGAAAGSGATSFISVEDVAAVATLALREPGHLGQVYDLTGGEALDHARVAAVLAGVLGRPVTFQDVPEPALRAGLEQAGLAAPQVGYLLDLYRQVREGRCAATLPTVARLLGRPPRTFADFALAHRDDWNPAAAQPSRRASS